MRLLAASVVLLLGGCLNETHILEPSGDSGASSSAQERLELTDEQVTLILDFLNACSTSLALLDDDVPLDKDAAESLIDHRDGADGGCGTEDDDLFEDLDEVDATPNVGDATILAVLAYLEGGGGASDGEWEGVSFTAEEVEVVLEIANEAAYDILDVDVDLPSNAVDEIIDARPHDTMEHLSETPQVGPAALEKLRDYVPNWTG